MEDDKQAKIELLRWLRGLKCPGCKSSHKLIDIEKNSNFVLCECQKCAKQWKINYRFEEDQNGTKKFYKTKS